MLIHCPAQTVYRRVGVPSYLRPEQSGLHHAGVPSDLGIIKLESPQFELPSCRDPIESVISRIGVPSCLRPVVTVSRRFNVQWSRVADEMGLQHSVAL
jgi:hypothetical protein